jgi:hypothetical protein
MDQETSRRLTEIEDIARGMRNVMRRRDTAVVPGDIAKLFDLVARLAQDVREMHQ